MLVTMKSAESESPPNFLQSPATCVGSTYLFFGLAAGLAGLAIAIPSADLPVSSWLRSQHIPGDLRKAIDLSEVFAHGLGAATILLTLWLLSPERRSKLWIAVAITLVSGVTANALKSGFVRIRPHAEGTIRVEREPAAWNSAGNGAELVKSSFWDSRQRSFPSGHAATAWGLAIGLSFVFPRGIFLFAGFATLASVQRLTSGAHYPTDVLAGAAIAFLTAALLLQIPVVRNTTWAAQSASRSFLNPSKE